MSQNHLAVAIVGPTGAGKSDLGLFLASAFAGEIINCDSVQVYRGLDVGSAKTPAESRQGIPHHMIDVASPSQELTAGSYARLARAAIQQVIGNGRLPIIVGGTGLYLRALLDGLSPAPPRDEPLRSRLRAVAERRGPALHRFLRRLDPVSSDRIHPNDHQKLIRAIEMTVVAGRPAADTLAVPRAALSGVDTVKIGLLPDRIGLKEKLNARAETMFRQGIVDEVRQLLAGGASPTSKPLQTLGYRQAVQFLAGEISFQTAISDCQTKTRQYAKRQLTWFRSDPTIHWLHGFGSDPAVQFEARKFLSRKLP